MCVNLDNSAVLLQLYLTKVEGWDMGQERMGQGVGGWDGGRTGWDREKEMVGQEGEEVRRVR